MRDDENRKEDRFVVVIVALVILAAALLAVLLLFSTNFSWGQKSGQISLMPKLTAHGCDDQRGGTASAARYEISLTKCGDQSLDRNGAVIRR
jgi:Tfp pilus assembly protein PilV